MNSNHEVMARRLSSEQETLEVRQFNTGAVRSKDADAYRHDLVSPIGLKRVAMACAEGIRKGYGAYNWEKGMPIHDILNHALEHIRLYLSGDRSEDHLGHLAWNAMAACHSEELWPHLNAGTLRGPNCAPPTEGLTDARKDVQEPVRPEAGRRTGNY